MGVVVDGAAHSDGVYISWYCTMVYGANTLVRESDSGEDPASRCGARGEAESESLKQKVVNVEADRREYRFKQCEERWKRERRGES